MLGVSWFYFIHNLVITYLTIAILNQLFYIRVDKKQMTLYMIWMQLIFIFNDFVIQLHFPLEYKYLCIFSGFTIGFMVFLKLPLVSSMLFMVVNLAVNGLATNINILTLLINQFQNYAEALKNDFYQYTALVMVMLMIFIVIKSFNMRMLDISRYN